jgi:myo-inositol-1(or 4)-monophosphatase
MTTSPVNQVRPELLRDLLIDAASIAARLYRVGSGARQKADGSLITEADVVINDYLRSTLQALFPGAAWLSEETADDLSRLGQDWLWVVDPLDGTKEFVRGVPEFAISVGLVHQHRAVLGGVVNPASGEGGVGRVGDGVEFWGDLRQRPAATSLSEAFASLSRSEIEDRTVLPFVDLVGSTCPVGSVAYKLLRVAAGREDLTFSVQPKSEWDICGGVALLHASDRVYRRFDARPLRFNERDTRIRSGAVAGRNDLVDEFLSKIDRRDITVGDTR